MPAPHTHLARLGSLFSSTDQRARIALDPIRFPKRFTSPVDQEVVAFLAASLAFGRIAAFSSVLESLLLLLGPSPASHLQTGLSPSSQEAVRRLYYRWITGDDLVRFLEAVGGILSLRGSLEGEMERHTSPETDSGASLPPFLDALRDQINGPLTPGLRFLLPDARRGGACKRQHLFLRWMVRSAEDGVDLGLWRCLSASRLLIPVDTHVFRISSALGLTQRTHPDLRASREITAALSLLDPEDPVKYDFVLCHLGVSGRCLGKRVESLCSPCALRDLCRLGGSMPFHPLLPA